MATKTRGLFVWHEIHASDPRAASAFYGKVAGWSMKPWEDDPSYLTLSAGPVPVAGAQALSSEDRRKRATPGWLPYVATDDVEVAVWEAQRLGGNVTRDTEALPYVGKFAVLQDPFGAPFAVVEPAWDPKPKYPESIGDFSWHDLITGDIRGAFRFYSALFGWEKTGSMDSPQGRYEMFGLGKRILGGMYREPGRHYWRSYIKVRDSRAAADAVTRGGGKILAGPMETAGGDTIVMAVDPQGAEFAVHAAKAKKKATAKVKKPATAKKPKTGKKTKKTKARR